MNLTPFLAGFLNNSYLQPGYPVFIFGFYLSLVGFRLVPLRKDRAKAEIWLKQWGRTLKFAGPAVVLLGLLLIALAQ
jgi:hypothetical protein